MQDIPGAAEQFATFEEDDWGSSFTAAEVKRPWAERARAAHEVFFAKYPTPAAFVPLPEAEHLNYEELKNTVLAELETKAGNTTESDSQMTAFRTLLSSIVDKPKSNE